MQYKKFIESHPLPKITKQMEKNAKGVSDSTIWSWDKERCYTAEIIDDILVVVVYSKTKGKLEARYRHLYDREIYATQDIKCNRRLSGTISTYLSEYNNNKPLDERSKQAIREYLPERFEDESKSRYGYEEISVLKNAEIKIKNNKKNQRYQKIKDKTDERMSCFREPPKEFFDWAKSALFTKYFFYEYKRGKVQSGYCSWCKTTFSAADIKHKGNTVCPSCGETLSCCSIKKLRSDGFGCKAKANYIDEIVDGDAAAIAERTFFVYQDIYNYKKGADKLYIQYTFYEKIRAFYDLDPEKGLIERFKDGEYIFLHGSFMNTADIRWCRRENHRGGPMSDTSAYIYPGNINAIGNKIKGMDNIDFAAITPHIRTDLYPLLKAVKRVPAIENLAKQGKYQLAQGSYHLGVFNLTSSGIGAYVSLREASPMKYLGVDKVTFREMGDISRAAFCLYKSFEKLYKVDMSLINRYTRCKIESHADIITRLLKKNKMSPLKFITYIEKQMKLQRKSGSTIVKVYRDYSDMVGDLKMERTESVVLPKDIQKEHDRIMKLKTALEYDAQNKLLAKRGEILHTLDYDNGRFLIVAFDKADDFLNESEKLDHCVKTYIQRCSEGETNIYGIRKSESPDEPYFTLTLDNGANVRANLGKYNCSPPQEIKDFVEEWKKKVIRKNKKKFIELADPKRSKSA